MTATKPSLDLLRSLTGEHVLRALMERDRLTRAEIAAITGISKPTVAEGVRRLEAAGMVVDTGERSSGRGRSGSYYALAETCGRGLAVDIGPEGIAAEVIDARGSVTASDRVELDEDADVRRVASTLRRVARRLTRSHQPVRVAVVSAADPVDRSSGRLVHLPDAPFLVGDLDPRRILSPLVGGPVHVDNDVNWSARAERVAGDLDDPDNFVYLHLGEGLGCAVVCDGRVWRGHSGLSGEIAHVTVQGPADASVPFIETFAALGLRHRGTTAVDVDAVRRQCLEAGPADVVVEQLARAIGDVCRAAIALADPGSIVLGGSWGTLRPIVDAVADEMARSARPTPVAAAAAQVAPSLAGAADECLRRLRNAIVEAQ